MTIPHDAVLYGAATSGVTLARAMEEAGMNGGCALLTAPSAYQVASVEGGACVTPSGPVDLATVYEARVFTPDAELRWVESGYAVLLTEEEGRLPASFGEPVPPLRAVKRLEARYLVWGAVKASARGWGILASARVGTVSVPMATARPRDRVRLTAREYVVADPEHGNAYVAEERLTGFEPYPLKSEPCSEGAV